MPVPSSHELRRALLVCIDSEAPRSYRTKELMSLVSEYFGAEVDSMSVSDRKLLKSNIKKEIEYLKTEGMLSEPSNRVYMVTMKGRGKLGENEEFNDALDSKNITEINETPDNLDMTDDFSQTQTENMNDDLDSEINETPDDLDMTDDFSQTQQEKVNDDLDIEINETPDNLDMTDDFSQTQTENMNDDLDSEINETPDDLDMTDDFSQTQQENVNDDLDSEILETPDDLDMTDDFSQTQTENMNDDLDSEISETPDNLDMTDDFSQTQTENMNDDLDSEINEIPDDLDMTDDFSQTQQENMNDDLDPEVHEIPDNLDMTDDDSQNIPAFDELTDDTAIESDSQNTNNIESEIEELTENINTINENHNNEVEPIMPNDEITEELNQDFSNALNQSLSIENVLERHNSDLADKVLMRAASLSPEMFSVFVTDLLSKMGYNAFQNARYTSDTSGNSLIQGVILDTKNQSLIYIHTNKLSPGRTIGRADIKDFVDEIADKGGKGIFATTGSFSEQAEIFAQDERLMLIDGKKLASLIISHNFCVNVEKVIEIKELDDDSFADYE